MNDTSLRLYEAKREELENAELWKKMRINFRLEAFKFPDNKIYGTVDIIPESSRQLIKTFVLVVNKTNRIEFNPCFTLLSASGFNITRKDPSAYVEAIPYNDQWTTEKKVSKICYFFFTGENFFLTPRINFELIKEEINLRIQWYHIGDKYAQKYVLFLDDAEVQYIRQKIIADAFDVRIRHFEPEEKHTIQLAARLNNGKETYRSDLIEFIVPNRDQINDDNTEFITASNDPIPLNLPVQAPTEKDITEEDFNPNERTSPPVELPKTVTRQNHQPLKRQKRKSRPKMDTCCNHIPHKTFPGIEHYFRNASVKSSSSSPDEHTSDDDDNDVIHPH